MAQVNAGRVRFVSRGEYNNSTQYYLFDLVDYNGSSYFAKANTTGNVPTNTTYWQLVAEKGNTGGDGPVGPTGNGIASIVKTASAGLIDTYTITFTNGSTTTFNVTNGQDGDVTQEYVDEENERLKSVFNVLPKVSGSGESVTLENTGDTMLYKMDLKGNTSQEVIQGEVGLEEEDTSIYVDDVNEDKENYITLKGNTYQDSTSGNQLLALKSGTYTSLGITKTVTNSSVIFSGVPERDWTNTDNISFDKPLTANTTYNISYTGNADIYLWFKNSLGTTVTSINLDTTIRSKTFTPNEEVTQYVIGINNMTVGTRVDAVVYPMLVSGSVAKDFEPYTNGASPNPDYPQEIEVVTGLNEVKVEGKNLLPNNITSQTINGITITKNNDGSLLINGTSNATTSLIFGEKTLQAGTYTISTHKEGTVDNSCYITSINTSTGSELAGSSFRIDNSNSKTYTLSETTTISYRFYTGGNRTFTNFKIYPMLEQSSTYSDYEAYQGASYPVNLGSIELCKIRTYQDSIVKDNGKWYLNKQIGKVVLNGSEDWILYLKTFVIDNLGTEKPNSICSSFSNKGSDWKSSDENNRGKYTMTNIENKFKCMPLTDMTLEEFKTWLSTHNTTVYYVLATPTETQITDTTLISQLNALYNATIHSTTHINTETSNLLPYIDLKYNVVTASPSPDRASEVEVVKGNNTITISNEDGTKTQTYNLTLGNLELCKIGDYQDYFYKDNGNWYKYGAIGKKVLDGSEVWAVHGGIASWFYYDGIIDGYVLDNTQVLIKTNYYTPKAYQGVPNLVNGECSYGSSDGGITHRFVIKNTDYTQVQDFKNWLSNNNTTVYYVLATPTQTQITDQLLVSQLDELQKAMSYYDKTLITQTNADKPFILDVVGIRDLQDIFNI